MFAVRSQLRYVPVALTTLRLLLSPLVLLNAFTARWRIVFLGCLIIAFVSDIYDGILARRLGVATPSLRRFDSITDIIFYGSAICCVWITHPAVIRAHAVALTVLLVFELAGDTIGLLKFGRWPAVHSYTAKVWGIFLFAALCQLLWNGSIGLTFDLTLIIGVATYCDWIAILLLRRTSAVDVPSSLHAMKWRRSTNPLENHA